MQYHALLDDAAQHAFGIETPAPLAKADRVHHDECDALGHVNNTSYMVWFERLRIAFMSHYGIGTLGKPGDPRIVIRSGHVHWKSEMFWGDDYVVTCRCTTMRTTSLTLLQEIWSGGRACAAFDCVMVLLAPEGDGRYAIPENVRDALLHDGAVAEPR